MVVWCPLKCCKWCHGEIYLRSASLSSGFGNIGVHIFSAKALDAAFSMGRDWRGKRLVQRQVWGINRHPKIRNTLYIQYNLQHIPNICIRGTLTYLEVNLGRAITFWGVLYDNKICFEKYQALHRLSRGYPITFISGKRVCGSKWTLNLDVYRACPTKTWFGSDSERFPLSLLQFCKEVYLLTSQLFLSWLFTTISGAIHFNKIYSKHIQLIY